MNESRFSFSHQPFPALPRIEQYVDVGNSDLIRKQCLDAIRRNAGPSVVLGGPGLGKTMTCMRIVQSCANIAETVLLSSSQIASRADLLKSILYELRMPYRGLFDGELRLSLIERLQHRRSQNEEKVVIVVDEAQAISPRLLEELRLLTNLTAHGQPCISLVLCGSLKLEEMLCHGQLESLQQRISARHFLRPLNQNECEEYVRHRIELAGIPADRVFDQSAMNAIYLVSSGIPRLVDQISERTIAMDHPSNNRAMTAFDVERAWHAHQQATPPWTDSTAIPTKSADISVLEKKADASRQTTVAISSDQTVEEDYSTKNISRVDSKIGPTLGTLVAETPNPEIAFKDADLSGWTENSVEFGIDSDTLSLNSRRGTPPSAGMGLSSVLSREFEITESSTSDRVHQLEEELNHFDCHAVTEALNGASARSVEMETEHSELEQQRQTTSMPYDYESVPLQIHELHNVNVGYGNAKPDTYPSFDLQPPVSIGQHNIEDDLLDMISNINMESISIDPFVELDTQVEDAKSPEHASGNLNDTFRADGASDVQPAHNRMPSFQSWTPSYFNDVADEANEYIEVQLTGGDIFSESPNEDGSDRLNERLSELKDVAANAQHQTKSFSLSDMEDANTIPMDDRDIIVVEEEIDAEELVESAPVNAPVAKALLQSYSKLFQDLRG